VWAFGFEVRDPLGHVSVRVELLRDRDGKKRPMERQLRVAVPGFPRGEEEPLGHSPLLVGVVGPDLPEGVGKREGAELLEVALGTLELQDDGRLEVLRLVDDPVDQLEVAQALGATEALVGEGLLGVSHQPAGGAVGDVLQPGDDALSPGRPGARAGNEKAGRIVDAFEQEDPLLDRAMLVAFTHHLRVHCRRGSRSGVKTESEPEVRPMSEGAGVAAGGTEGRQKDRPDQRASTPRSGRSGDGLVRRKTEPEANQSTDPGIPVPETGWATRWDPCRHRRHYCRSGPGGQCRHRAPHSRQHHRPWWW